MDDQAKQNKLIALALYEIRVLLASKLGSENEADMPTRIAAHLSYALHSEALAVIEGNDFDLKEALSKIKAIDDVLKEKYSTHLIEQFNNILA